LRKGVNLPGVALSAPVLTEKDLADLRFACALPVDLVALSFVRSPDDAGVVRRAMASFGATLPLFAKIEKPEAVGRLDAIADAFDGLLVARGDLGVELPLERVPGVQKRAIRLAREHARPVMVATQMLESMVERERPTRAEVSDVANAVLDGADALMLTAETGAGAHPVEAAATMARIIAAAESDAPPPAPIGRAAAPDVAEATVAAAVAAAVGSGARALVAFTRTGTTARLLARHRPSVPILAFAAELAIRRQLTVVWGVEPLPVPEVATTDAMVAEVDRALVASGRAAAGDLVVIVAGTPPGVAGLTNTLRLHRVACAREIAAG
jgi:pyruvate kinase